MNSARFFPPLIRAAGVLRFVERLAMAFLSVAQANHLQGRENHGRFSGAIALEWRSGLAFQGDILVGYLNIDGDLTGVKRCPHCSIANPQLKQLWRTNDPLYLKDVSMVGRLWATYQCTSCAEVVLVKCDLSLRSDPHRPWPNPKTEVEEIYPSSKVAHDDIPEPARTFLQQAFDTLHAPDAAAVMAGSAVDAMLKRKGLSEGTLYARIDGALEKNLLTQGMADWAHKVRLGSNRPRHADEERPHVSPEEAKQSVEFAEALGNFLFVLSARIQRGLNVAGVEATKVS